MSNIDFGPDCKVCGYKRTHVTHDTPEERADPANPLSRVDPKQDGLSYYEWARVEFHEFVANRAPHVHRFRCACGEEMPS